MFFLFKLLGRVDTISRPMRTLFNRQFNMCQILKSKKMFRNTKELYRSRLSRPIECPYRKGYFEVSYEHRFEETLLEIQSFDEIRRMFPAVASQSRFTSFNIYWTLQTRIHDKLETIASWNLTDYDLRGALTHDFVKT